MTKAEYGFWKSPITSDRIIEKSVRLGNPQIDGDDLYWLEGRPSEGGRSVLARRRDGLAEDVTPQPFNVRTRVHEYGGGAFIVDRGVVFFSNFKDQRLYRLDPGSEPEAITPENAWRYADARVDHGRNRLIAVREDHSDTSHEAVNTIVSIPAAGGEQTVLVSGADFYSNPRLSPDGTHLSWLQWNHPNMPWDGTELWVADIASEGSLGEKRRIAGGPEEPIFQPEWSPNGTLHFVSDRNGYWNLFTEAGPVHERRAEFGLPQWVFGMTTYGFRDAGTIITTYTENGEWRLAQIDTKSGKLTDLDVPFTSIDGLQVRGDVAVFSGASPTEPAAIVRLDFSTGEHQVLRRSSEPDGELRKYFSVPKAVEFPTANGKTAHAIHYAPHNPDFEAPEDEKPPLIVLSHGGPTAQSESTLSLAIQYWTSRGFAVVNVNYGGSTGYGREYRKRLNGNWGIVDVEDCTNAALYLAEQGLADRGRLIIKGGSAGGYTTMACLAFRDDFAAGASYYGVSNLEALARDTHKFESCYLDNLVGPYPERKDLYEARSPSRHVDKLSAPIIFFQGSEDPVVPPNQTESMVDALNAKGIPNAYVLFEGEQHGFRNGDNIKRALDAELTFYATMVLKKGIRY